MSGADRLRRVVGKAAVTFDISEGIWGGVSNEGYYERLADAIVDALDVRDGWAEGWSGRDWIVNAWANDPRQNVDGTPMEPVLVVRPQEEPADA